MHYVCKEKSTRLYFSLKGKKYHTELCSELFFQRDDLSLLFSICEKNV